MQRKVMNKLVEWKNSPERKPLILQGARQVGKTWLMKEFGKKYFDNYVYFNFDEDTELYDIFAVNKSANRIIERLSLLCGKEIKPQTTLIIFDEIQECGNALNSLKYFNENAKNYCVISAGSLLGTFLAEKSYPVGQTDIINVYPLSFEEFLQEENPNLFKVYEKFSAKEKLEEIFCTQLKEIYETYLIVGGLPECVNSWTKYKNPQKVDEIQDNLISLYEKDFSKHNGKVNSAKILMLFRNIVPQLAKENKKFIYQNVQSGARARTFEESIEWLVSAGIVNRVYNSSNNQYPIKAYDELSAFKLYLFDTGLLRRMARIDNSSIILNKDFQFKGALIENYVLQQLKGKFDADPTYYTFDKYEIDFLVQDKTNIIPIEVKSSTNVSSTSIKNYIEKYSPKRVIRYSLLNYEKQKNITNIPLYFVEKSKEIILI